MITSKVIKGKEEEGAKYRDYFDFSEPLNRASSHRLLALRRGEAEGILRVSISPDAESCLDRLNRRFVKGRGEVSEQVATAVDDSFKRLLKPSIETEFSNQSKAKADEEAIRVFAENLRQLLLAPPLGQKRVLGVDPGYRTGCKLVCLDAQGNLLHNEAIFPHPPQNEKGKAAAKVAQLVATYAIDAIAIGNGTASRETEQFITNIRYDRKVQVFVVSENGASIYSASKIAREEFPEYDVTVRGAVSIGRRLMDPLAELVKIDPKSIGVGQYQHDVEQKRLEKESGSNRGELREFSRCKREYGEQAFADLHLGIRPYVSAKHRELPGGARTLHFPERTDESPPYGREGFRAKRRIPTDTRRKESVG